MAEPCWRMRLNLWEKGKTIYNGCLLKASFFKSKYWQKHFTLKNVTFLNGWSGKEIIWMFDWIRSFHKVVYFAVFHYTKWFKSSVLSCSFPTRKKESDGRRKKEFCKEICAIWSFYQNPKIGIDVQLSVYPKPKFVYKMQEKTAVKTYAPSYVGIFQSY